MNIINPLKSREKVETPRMAFPYSWNIYENEIADRVKKLTYPERRKQVFDSMIDQLSRWMIEAKELPASLKTNYLNRGYGGIRVGTGKYDFRTQEEADTVKKDMMNWANASAKAGSWLPIPEPSKTFNTMGGKRKTRKGKRASRKQTRRR
jgi:hypothetical protein